MNFWFLTLSFWLYRSPKKVREDIAKATSAWKVYGWLFNSLYEVDKRLSLVHSVFCSMYLIFFSCAHVWGWFWFKNRFLWSYRKNHHSWGWFLWHDQGEDPRQYTHRKDNHSWGQVFRRQRSRTSFWLIRVSNSSFLLENWVYFVGLCTERFDPSSWCIVLFL